MKATEPLAPEEAAAEALGTIAKGCGCVSISIGLLLLSCAAFVWWSIFK